MDLNALIANTQWVRALSMDMLGDSQRAEDVVQETLISALHYQGKADWSGGRMRAWLAQVARNFARTSMRSDSRRRARETEHAAAESLPSASEALERIELQRKTAEAVMALASPDREIIALCYFDGLSPAQVARQLGMTSSAVHTRLSRARALLRRRLEGEYSQVNKNWSMVILAWAARPGSLKWTLSGALAGGLFMKTTLSILGIITIAIIAWLSRGAFQSPEFQSSAGLGFSEAELLDPLDQDPSPMPSAQKGESALAAKRTEVDSLPAAEFKQPALEAPPMELGRVRVSVIDEQGLGVPGVGLNLYPHRGANNWFHRRHRTTDALGLCEFEGQPGAFTVYLERPANSQSFDARQTQLMPGETSKVQFQLGASSSVRGLVLGPSGQPVAGAAIWLGDGTGAPYYGQVVTHSASDGSFEIKHISGHQGVAARASGYGPSLALMPLFYPAHAGSPHQIELRLTDWGGSIDGKVVDSRGTPLVDAIVWVGNAEMGRIQQHEERPAYDPPPQRLRTDMEGRFHADGVQTGSVKVIARALGFGIQSSQVEVPRAGAASMILVLGPTAHISGSVHMPDGSPARDARVELESDGDAQLKGLANAHTQTDHAGEFLLNDLPAGNFRLIASVDKRSLSVSEQVQTQAGQELRWEAQFPSVRILQGRLLDPQDRPLVGWTVRRETQAPDTQPGNMERISRTTDSEGAFRFDPCPLTPQTLSALPPGQWMRPAAVQLEGVIPGSEEILLRVPASEIPRAALFGRLVDQDGNGLASIKIQVKALDPTFVLHGVTTNAEGLFQVEHLPSSNFSLLIDAPGFQHVNLPTTPQLGESEQRNLGSIELASD